MKRIYPIFHISALKLYHRPEGIECLPEQPSPLIIDDNEEYEVERILDSRIYYRKK